MPDPRDRPRGRRDDDRTRILGLPAEHLPPQDLDAERAVLASMIRDNDRIAEVLEILREDDFYHDRFRAFFRGIKALWEKGTPVDTITLSDAMTLAGDYESSGGDDGLCGIMDADPYGGFNARAHAAIVVEKSMARETILGAHRVLDAAYSGRHTGGELIEQLERLVFAVADRRVRLEESAPIGRISDAYLGEMTARQQGRVDQVFTGFCELDGLLDGFLPGRLYVLASRPSMGKTAIGLNICEYLATERGGGRGSLIVSLEMGGQEIAERMLSARSGVPARAMRARGGLKAEDFIRLGRARDELAEVPIVVDDSPGITASRIEATGRRAILRQRVKLILVDYLQLVSTSDLDVDGREQEVSALSRRLKEMARRLGVPVLALSQLNRKLEERADRRPRLSDLRESGAIEQDADAVLLLHRPDYYNPADQPGVAEVIVAKNRQGRTGMVRLLWQSEMTRFVNYAPDPAGGIPAGEPF